VCERERERGVLRVEIEIGGEGAAKKGFVRIDILFTSCDLVEVVLWLLLT
jgi:hypothetical protein